ncbi:MAG: conjugal transfer protein TraG N-terminal domain-containing protein [Thermofilum sp.]
MDYTLYTYGSGELIARIFESVKLFLSGGVIGSLVKIILLVAVLRALLFGISNIGSWFGGERESGLREVEPVAPLIVLMKNTVIAAVIVYVFLNPLVRVSVIIEDRYEPVQSRVVDDVPWGLAFIASGMSRIGDRLGEIVEEYLTPVDAVRMRSGGGVGVGAKLISGLFDIVPPGAPVEYGAGSSNVPIRAVVEAWLSECIYPKFALIEGEGERAEGLRVFASSGFLLGEPVFAAPPFGDPNTPLTVQFVGYGSQNETTCANAQLQIQERWGNSTLFERWVARFGAQFLGRREDDIEVPYRVYEMVDRYFPDSQYSTWEKIAQLAVLNTAYSAFLKLTAEYGQAGAADIARRRQTGAWLEAAKIGARTLMVLRQVAEAVIYLAGGILPVFIAAAGLGVLIKYIRAVFWLQLWIPVLAVFNAIGDYHLAKMVESVGYVTGGTFTIPLNFETVDKLRAGAGFILGYLGILSMVTPGLAWGILRGAENLGGLVGGLVASREGASVGAAAVTERTGALVSYSGGTMVASAHASGIGQMHRAGEIQTADRYGLGAVAGVAAASLEQAIVGLPLVQGRIESLRSLGPETLFDSGYFGTARDVMSPIASRDTWEYMRGHGIIPESMSYPEYVRATQLGSTVNTPDGRRVTSYFSPSGDRLFSVVEGTGSEGYFRQILDSAGVMVTGTREGTLTLRDPVTGRERKIYGSMTVTKDGFTVTGIDTLSGSQVMIRGDSGQIDLARGEITGYRTAVEQSSREYVQRMVVSKQEAERLLAGVEKVDPLAHEGLKRLSPDRPVELAVYRDPETGNIARVEARQGSTVFSTDHFRRLEGFHESRQWIQEMEKRFTDRGDIDFYSRRFGGIDFRNATYHWEGDNVSLRQQITTTEQATKIAAQLERAGFTEAARTLRSDGIARIQKGMSITMLGEGSRSADRLSTVTLTTGASTLVVDRGQTIREQEIANVTQVRQGTFFNFGNDTISVIVAGDEKVLARNYRQYFAGDTPSQGGYVLVDKIAKEAGGYTRISEAIRRELSVSGGIDATRIPILGSILRAAGTTAGVEVSKSALEGINADAVRIGLQEYYKSLFQERLTPEQRAEKFAREVNRFFEWGNFVKDASMPGKIVTPVPQDGDKTPKQTFEEAVSKSDPGDTPGW